MQDRELIERDLDSFVVGESWPAEQPDGSPEPILDRERATRVLRRIRRLTGDMATMASVAQADLDRITEWRDDRLAGIQSQIDWARQSLENFTRLAMPKGKKQIQLPDGKLKLTTNTKGKIDVHDEAAFIAWAESRELVGDTEFDVVALKPTVSKAAIEKVLTQTDEPIATEIDNDGSEFKVYGFYEVITDEEGLVTYEKGEPARRPIPGVVRRVPAVDRFNYELGAE